MSDVAALLREAREEAGLSVRALARLSDVSFTTISRIENRRIDPTFSTVEKLLVAMGQTLRLSRQRTKPIPSLADLVDAWSMDAAGNEEPEWTRLRAFVDYLHRHPEDAQASILETPEPSGSLLLDNLFAAVADKIADDNDLRRPSWTKRVPALDTPWDGMMTTRGRASARMTSPRQFVDRNIFIPEETLWRRRDHAGVT